MLHGAPVTTHDLDIVPERGEQNIDRLMTLLRVVDLPTLIEIKTQAGRPQDRLVVPILLALQGQLSDA